MSVHTREEILARLSLILQNIEGFETHARNRGMLANDKLPATFLMDGNETVKTSAQNKGRLRMSPCIVQMSPQIFIVLKNKKPQNEGIGQELNAMRQKVIRAIADDVELLALIGSNGDLQYIGCETDLNTGDAAEGQMQINLAVVYTFNPYSN